MEIVARKGFGATIDEIARHCAVSPRTIFRHYDSHDALIVETVKEMFNAIGQRADGGPTPEEDVVGWLDDLAHTIHSRNVAILGDAFWDTHAPPTSDSGVLKEVAKLRGDYRRRGVNYLALVAWRNAGGAGTPPQTLQLAFALLFSAFATQALTVDFERSPDEIGALTASILTSLLLRAVDDQRAERSGGDAQTDHV